MAAAKKSPTDVQQAVALASKLKPEELGEYIQDLQYSVSKAKMAVLDAQENLKKCAEAVALRSLEAHQVTYEAMLDTVKGMMLNVLTDNGLTDITTATGYRYAVRTSPGALEIVDEDKLKEMRGDLFRSKTTVAPDKKAIKSEVEAGRIPSDWAVIKFSTDLHVTELK